MRGKKWKVENKVNDLKTTPAGKRAAESSAPLTIS
jgi:hypothetical protein